MQHRLWFKAKRYGYGWYPCTWQGWLILAVGLALILGNVFWMTDRIPHVAPLSQVLPALIPTWIVAALLVWISWLTGEKARWRWGGK